LLRASCLTGAWGGSHLLAFTGGDLGSRLPRRLCSGGGFAAAWELYLRRRLCELGYLDEDDCLLGLLQRKAAIESAILDFDLHSGLVGAREAGERMATLPVADSTDLVYLARHPGTAVAGVLGWLDMETARAEHLSREGADFDDARFHGFLLGGGPIPPALVLSSGIA
jgi:uncharacterized protein (DUF885 family)